MRNCSRVSEAQSDAIELIADDDAARPNPVIGKRQRQRELTESVAKTLGVSKRQGRRVIAAQKKKATGQGDFFGGGSGMSKIIRAARPAKNWTEISNFVLRDKRLSYRARGILARLLSNADGFAMNADDLAHESPCEGRDAVRTALAELQNCGYLQRVKSQDEKGRWRTDLYIYDTPQTDDGKPVVGSPTPGKPTTGKPAVGESGALRKTIDKKQEEKTPQQPARESAAAVPAGGGAFSKELIEAAAGLGLSEKALRANAKNANDDQLQILLQLYKSPPPGLRSSAAWAAELARRANAGTLTAVTQEAHDSANAEIYVSSPKEVEEYLENLENSRAARNKRLGHQKAKPHQGRQTPASAF